jgi:hypothetical protein
MLLLGALSLAGVSQSAPAKRFVSSAQQFAIYYHTLERTSVRAGFWDRVALSLALASASSTPAECAGDPPTS